MTEGAQGRYTRVMRAPSKTHMRAKALRGTMPKPEVLLWLRLRRRSPNAPKFRRQHPVGPYILDFYCAEARLCIEIDGYSHGIAGRAAHDARRDAYLADQGIQVVRYPAATVLQDLDDVAASIMEAAKAIIRR